MPALTIWQEVRALFLLLEKHNPAYKPKTETGGALIMAGETGAPRLITLDQVPHQTPKSGSLDRVPRLLPPAGGRAMPRARNVSALRTRAAGRYAARSPRLVPLAHAQREPTSICQTAQAAHSLVHKTVILDNWLKPITSPCRGRKLQFYVPARARTALGWAVSRSLIYSPHLAID